MNRTLHFSQLSTDGFTARILTGETPYDIAEPEDSSKVLIPKNYNASREIRMTRSRDKGSVERHRGPVHRLVHTGKNTHSRHSKREWLDYQGWPGGVTGSDLG